MKNFEGFGLHPALGKSLAAMDYDTPTPIQAQAIPLALQGRDIMGSAQTGTGKTAAYSIPVIEALLQNKNNHALVLTPTRELGKQVMEIMKQLLGPKSEIKTAFIIGGEAMHKQYGQLRQGPRLVVGTPGRINDHLRRGSLKLDKTNFLVLDETDRMLDMGFSVQLDEIFKFMPRERQTLMFSATLPKNILKMSERYLDNPERVAVGSTTDPAKNIKQDVIRLQDSEKYEELTRQLEQREGSIIMFVKTKRSADKMSERLNDAGHRADAIHGDLKQNRRDRVIREFRGQRFRILVATDVAARGLDIPHIEHVINYDLPQVPEDYIHRIGRTARAGAEGSALCLVTPADGRKWFAIEQLMDPNAKPTGPMPAGKNAKHNRKKKKYVSSRSRNKRNEENKGGSKEGADEQKKPFKGAKPKHFKPKRDDENGSRSDAKPFHKNKNHGHGNAAKKDNHSEGGDKNGNVRGSEAHKKTISKEGDYFTKPRKKHKPRNDKGRGGFASKDGNAPRKRGGGNGGGKPRRAA